jgi:hypothetical protein
VEEYWIKIMLMQKQNSIEGEYESAIEEIKEEVLKKLCYIFRFEDINEKTLFSFSQKVHYPKSSNTPKA